MRHPPCRYCRDGRRDITIRNSQDVQDYLACFDARFPPFITRLKGLYVQLERATR